MEFVQINIDSLMALKPEISMCVGIISIFLIDMIFGTRRGLKLALSLIVLSVTALYLTGQFLSFYSADLFSGLLFIDQFSTFFKLIFVATTAFVILIIYRSKEFASAGITEIIIFLLTITLGMMMLSSSINLLMIYISMETISLLSYVLVGYKIANRPSSEAALKYVLFGGVASGIMLFGMSYYYGMFGTLNLFEIREAISTSSIDLLSFPILFANILIIAGFGFKIAMVPFHMWCPDVYEGAPTPVTAFLSIGPKAAGLAVLIRFIMTVFEAPGGLFMEVFDIIRMPELLAVLSILTMTLGNLAAIPQNNLKRLLAYSSIAHAGYLLMGLAALSREGVEAVLFYLPIYLFMNLGAFLVVIAIRDATGSEDISAYKGLGKKSPYISIAMAVFLFSLTGLPPLAGFLGKFYLFAAVIKKQMYILATIGVINSVISLFYYTRVIKAMFLADDSVVQQNHSLKFCNLYAILAAIFVVGNVALIFYFEPLIKIVRSSALTIF